MNAKPTEGLVFWKGVLEWCLTEFWVRNNEQKFGSPLYAGNGPDLCKSEKCMNMQKKIYYTFFDLEKSKSK